MSYARTALIGDYNSTVKAHVAIPLALDLVAKEDKFEVEPVWVHTSELANKEALRSLRNFDGIWCVPSSPYFNGEGAIAAIELARTEGIPFLGTCAGFQYALLEYFRNVVGMREAENAEENPQSKHQVISRLSCSLVEATGGVWLTPGSLASKVYGTDHVEEGYNCSYGFNPQYVSLLVNRPDIEIEGRDDAGNVRIFRLPNHPFFVATLFQPERSSLKGAIHPLIREFVLTTWRRKGRLLVDAKSGLSTQPVHL
jgi:CTP synthase (UTP-ammonia lyase)